MHPLDKPIRQAQLSGFSGRVTLAALREQGHSIRTETFWSRWRHWYWKTAWHSSPAAKKPPPLRGNKRFGKAYREAALASGTYEESQAHARRRKSEMTRSAKPDRMDYEAELLMRPLPEDE
jgi:hypothetical protein